MSDLTTQFLYRTAFKKTAPAGGDDKNLAQWITAVSDAVERECDRTFGVTTYKKWLDGSGSGQIVLPDYPVQSVYGISICTSNALQITNTTAKIASASTELTGLRLYSISTAGAETDTLLLYATYATITALKTAVDAVAGWSATILSGMDNEPTILIKPYLQDMCISPATFEVEVASEFEPVRIRSESDRVIERTFSGDAAIWYPATLSAQGAMFPEGRSNIFVWYKAGYTLSVDNGTHTALSTTGTLPASLVHIVNTIVKGVEDSYSNSIGGVASESIGDYSYSLKDNVEGIIEKVMEANAGILTPFKRLCLWV